MFHKQPSLGAHEQGRTVKLRFVRMNYIDTRKIHRRQTGATIKRTPVTRNGVQAQTVRVTFVSSRRHNKTNIGVARNKREQRFEK
jgi:hypothetical protein